jgi:hypothetical protein
MNQFPHLKFAGKIEGLPIYNGGGQNERSKKNRENRQGHAVTLLGSTSQLQLDWEDFLTKKSRARLT